MLSWIGDDEMEGDVDMAFAFRQGVIFAQRLAQGLALFLKAERQPRGVATERSRARATGKTVRHDDAIARGLREMDVAVDTAGQHQVPGRVDHGCRRAEIVAEGHDLAVANADIAGKGV